MPAMRRRLGTILITICVAACRTPPEPSAKDVPPAPAEAVVAPILPPQDATTISKLSKELFREFDANDAARVGQLLADRFALVDSNYFTPREQLLKVMTAREHEKFPVILERSWSDETVRFFGDTALFTGFTSA